MSMYGKNVLSEFEMLPELAGGIHDLRSESKIYPHRDLCLRFKASPVFAWVWVVSQAFWMPGLYQDEGDGEE